MNSNVGDNATVCWLFATKHCTTPNATWGPTLGLPSDPFAVSKYKIPVHWSRRIVYYPCLDMSITGHGTFTCPFHALQSKPGVHGKLVVKRSVDSASSEAVLVEPQRAGAGDATQQDLKNVEEYGSQ